MTAFWQTILHAEKRLQPQASDNPRVIEVKIRDGIPVKAMLISGLESYKGSLKGTYLSASQTT